MKAISFKKVLFVLIVLLIFYLVIDVILNSEESIAAFNQGYQDMNTLQEQRSKQSLK